MNKCIEFLQEGFFTFSSISDEEVLMEVLNHDKGIKYLIRMYKLYYYIKNQAINLL